MPGGILVAFIEGEYTPIAKTAFSKCRPSLLIRQLTVLSRFPEAFDALIACVEDTQCALAAFMCHQHDNKRGEWHTLSVGIDEGTLLQRAQKPREIFPAAFGLCSPGGLPADRGLYISGGRGIMAVQRF